VRGLVARPALFDRLSAAGPGEVMLVCGPAGSGKTVLVRSWAEREGPAGRVAWVSVERDERDAQRFWLSVIDELAGVVGRDELVKRVAATPAFQGQAVVERLLSDLHSLEQPVVLVLDDLHELRAEDALRWLELFLAGLPPELRLVIVTRQEPSIGLHGLRLAGRLTELRAADLRFSLEETRQLLESSGAALSDAAVELLHERTEGWAAGLRLAAISLALHPDPERFVTEFCGTERTVAAYLLAEVLELQPPEVRDLLLRTSILERVSGPLADALTGGRGSEEVLQRLEDANAFITALDVGRTWFRYHHLLSDLLQLELRRSSPALIAPLHRAAAQWLNEHGHVVEAIRHAESAGDWAYAARLLADNYVDLVFDGRKATLRALLTAFPADAWQADAELALAFTTARLHDGLLDEVPAYLSVAERLVATLPGDRRPLFDLQLTSARLWLACERGDLQAARQAIRSLQAQAARIGGGRADDHRASALMSLGIAELWSLNVDDAGVHLEAALALARRIRRPYLEIGCLGHLAVAAVISGAPVDFALRLSEEALTLAERHGWGTHRIVAPAVAAGASALAWLGRIDEAERWLERAEPSQTDELEAEPVLRYAAGFVRLGQGRFEDALADFRAAESVRPSLAGEHVLPAEVRGWILHTQGLLGDTAAVRTALAGLDAHERDGAGMRIAEAAVALAGERPQDAVETLAPLLAHVPEPEVDASAQVLNLRRATAHALLLDAVARDRLGDPGAAEASIERALELAERDGTILEFMLVPVRELLERHPRHSTGHGTLVSTVLDLLRGGSPTRPERPSASLRDELSEAEMRVVRYLPSNLKAGEIAAELYVSSNTVRTHLRHIYAKLDVHNRSAAVARARELRLLAPGGPPPG
jgi:LuxR family maltose regulon positive regulatory protein